jgi:hypothetical protein
LCPKLCPKQPQLCPFEPAPPLSAQLSPFPDAVFSKRGQIDHLTFETESVRFDYQPAPRELALPVHYETRRPDQIVLQAFAPKP